ncbi:hypothetical protein [Bacteroides acidifaciens]|uniref:hypothetical protein n=1 Tax=Bacteroides acidifaciens TaxID=85831 RepID=UPI002588516F|nr:hypothetical protein [Bacteroides acidifaciens]
MAYSNLIREEELKNKIASDFFSSYDTTQILGDVDFCIAQPIENGSTEAQYFLWAEAKKGNKSILEESITQLILTIGKARTFEKHLPPSFIGAFDASKIAFVSYNSIHEVFYKNDFNWNVTPSDHTTKEFLTVLDFVKRSLFKNLFTFDFDKDKKDLKKFVKANFKLGKKRISRIKISKNNFVVIYQKWLKEVKSTIVVDWNAAKNEGVFDSDFYLADLLSKDDVSIKEKLQVLLEKTHYTLGRKKNELGLFTSSRADFNDNQKAHKKFWNRYERPPKREYWDYIINRKDLLVPQDVRERQGSFFTPQKWVELSQQYLADELGEDWQDQYFIWDCAAGTGNLLNGLTNKYRIWASTLNQADVDVMRERIENGANLLNSHVFQFDFLNDSFDKLPDGLRDIINDEERRKNLVIYINPPYAEGDNRSGEGRSGVAESVIKLKYATDMGYAKREMFIQFMTRIYKEIAEFRSFFRAKLGRNFLVPANTFDNVTGDFPIGFFIYHLGENEVFTETLSDVYAADGAFLCKKTILSYDNYKVINDWTQTFIDKPIESSKGSKYSIGTIIGVGNDFQNQRTVRIENSWRPWNHQYQWQITANNLFASCIYLVVRTIISADWLNDRDQFLSPTNNWEEDTEFQNDCLAYTIFHTNIKSSETINHWIPFPEKEVDAHDSYKSHFMIDFISGKKRPRKEADLFSGAEDKSHPLTFSAEAEAVLNAGRELWRYYHSQPDSNPDASLYDIKLYFQGTKLTKNGKVQMKTNSDDERYMELIQNLREKLRALASKIEPKVYEYGFLKR